MLRDIWEVLWLMVPAAGVANGMGLNRKTAQGHYRGMREYIAMANAQERS